MLVTPFQFIRQFRCIPDAFYETADDTAGRTISVAAATEEKSANMSTVAAAAEQAATNIALVSTATEEMNSTTHNIVEFTKKAQKKPKLLSVRPIPLPLK
jgi:methyl-accepting chemotaxis protein